MIIGINAQFINDPKTGLGSYVIQLIKTLAEIDKKNIYHLYLPDHAPSIKELPKNFIHKKIKLKKKDRYFFDKNFTKSDTYKKNIPDVLHIPHFKIPAEPGNTKIILTLHDIIPVVFLRPGYLFRGKTPLKMISSMGIGASIKEPFLIKKASKVITISNASKKDINKYLFYPEEKISVIYNGFDSAFTEIRDKAFLKKIKTEFKINKPFMINFGGLVVRKNIERQIKAYQSLPESVKNNLDFFIAGDGYWKNKLEMSLKKNESIKFLGKIDRKKLRALVSLANFSIYASLYEGFGFPILESISCSTPVITSATSSMNEILTDTSIRVNPYSVRELKNAIIEIFSNKQKWIKKVKEGKKELKNFTWKKAAREYLREYTRQGKSIDT